MDAARRTARENGGESKTRHDKINKITQLEIKRTSQTASQPEKQVPRCSS